MNIVSQIISELACNYFDKALADNRECRLLVPASLKEMAYEIHNILKTMKKRSFLVVSKDELPSKEKGWLQPDGLTSERVGSFIAICSPGVLSHLQDSISGTGGAIRSLAFSDEWPWVDNGPSSFSFKEEVLPRICKNITSDEDQQKFIGETILKLVSSSSGIKHRQQLLLGEILGYFEASNFPTISSLVEKFLSHAGLPRATSYGYDKDYLENLEGVAGKIINELKVLDRPGLMLRIDEKFESFSDAERKDIKVALNDFLDGLGEVEQFPGILILRSGFSNNLGTWVTLSLEVLENIFGKTEKQPNVMLEVTFSSARSISHENSIATFKDEEITCTVSYDFPLTGGTNEIKLLQGGKELHSAGITNSKGTVTIPLDTRIFFNSYKKKISITVQAFVDGLKVKDKKGSIHLCGGDRPGFLVAYPNMDVIDPVNKTLEDLELDDVEKLIISEPVDIFLFSVEGGVILDENFEQLESKEVYVGVIKSAKAVDPCESAGGTVTIYCQVGTHSTASVSIEATEVMNGEFTLEDEFRSLLSLGSNTPRFKNLLEIFSGTSRERYRNLGDLNDKTNRRSFLSRFFERGEQSYLPVVVNLALGSSQETVWSCARVVGNVPQLSTLNDEVGKEVKSLVESYAQTRLKLMHQVISILDIVPEKIERPLYAEVPIFVDAHSEILQDIICEFLGSYLSILRFVGKNRQRISWGELFLLSYLDCIVDLGPKYDSKFFLIGPWHPLVICKRYFVQSSLFRSAQRFSKRETKSGFNRLANLLQFITPSRWAYMVDTKAKGYKKAYLSALSDPAWILGLNVGEDRLASSDVKEVLELMVSKLGLYSNVLPASCENLAGNYVKDYLNAYPSRRAIGMGIEESYMPGQVIRSLDELFLLDKGDDPQVAIKLPGGIHCYFKTSLEDVDCSSRPESSRVFIYEGYDELCDNIPVDLSLLPPIRDISFSRYEEKQIRLPRGRGDESVFYFPLTRLDSGLEAMPTSQLLEIDYYDEDASSFESKFLDMVSSLACMAAEGTCTNLQANLPDRLKCFWNVLPGMQLDPAIFKYYVNAGAKKNEDRALWDYNVDIDGRLNTYYVLSKVPPGIIKSLNKNPVLGRNPAIIKDILTELGEIGIAIGSEAMKTSSRSLGVVGLIAAIRLFTQDLNGIPSPLSNGDWEVGFLLPVDSFKAFLGELNSESQKRADLLAVQITLPDDSAPIRISACAIECKYSSSVFQESAAKEALEQQALSTIENFKYLIEAGKHGGTPEKLALINLINFGLRTKARESIDWTILEQKVLQSILNSNYEFVEPRCGCVLVSTEIELQPDNALFSDRHGYWVRLSPGCWPGTGSHSNLDYSMKMLSALFSEIKVSVEPKPERGAGSSLKVRSEGEGVGTPESLLAPESGKDIQGPVLGGFGMKHEETIETTGTTCNEGVKFHVGTGLDMTRSKYEFWPSNTDLTQLNIGIVGDLGQGKTQLVQNLIYNIARSGAQNGGVPPKFLILDYKKDYSDPEKAKTFIDLLEVNVLEPFKIPLSLFDVGPEARQVDKVNKANFFIDVLKKIYGNIGPVQELKLRQAILDCYLDASITGTVPTIRQVYDKYFAATNGTADSPLSILDNLCSLEVFEDNHSKLVPFKDFFKGVTAVNLSYFGSDDQSKNMLVVFFLNIFYDYMIRLHKKPFKGEKPQLRNVDSFLLVDEADNIMRDNFPVLKQLLLQGREFGVGVLLASQYMSHFKTSANNYAEPLLTWFIHNVPNISKSELSSIGLTGITEEIIDRIKSLKKHECFYKSLGVPGRFMKGIPFYELIKKI